MGGKSKENSSVVKIDPMLLGSIEDFISKDENRFRFANKKQFVDLAVSNFLDKMQKEGKN